MNVLIFVMTMLMLLAALTYARLETYRSSQVFQLFFTHYMEKEERGYINMAAEELYKKTKGSSKSAENKSDEKVKKDPAVNVAATPRISLMLFTNKMQHQTNPEAFKQTQLLFKKLIQTLYADQPFYKNALEKRPGFIDELMAAIIKAVDDLPEGTQLKKASELANLRIPEENLPDDERLDKIFYKMLHGAPYKDITKKENEEKSTLTEKVEPELDEDQADASLESDTEEYHSPEGYYTLLDFINLSKTPQIRIYLARREILKTVFHDDSIVDEIINQRNELYKQAIDGQQTNELSKSFQNQFEQRRDPEIESKYLNFTVTKTNPKLYERNLTNAPP